MAERRRAAGNGRGLIGWLYGLGGLDLLLSAGIILMLVVMGRRDQEHTETMSSMAVGIAGMLMMLQCAVRCAELIIAANWTHWMVRRSLVSTQTSPRWAWLGWFVPVVSLWIPCQILLRLNRTVDGTPRHSPLILAWWLARWLTCPSGVFVLLFVLGVSNLIVPDAHASVDWLIDLAIPGALAAGLGILVRRLTFNNQPSDIATLAATVF